jgi:hypothetical protein
MTENQFDIENVEKTHTLVAVYNKKSSTYKACPESIQPF